MTVRYACRYAVKANFAENGDYLGSIYTDVVPEWSEFEPIYGQSIEMYDRFLWIIQEADVPDETPPSALEWDVEKQKLQLKSDESERGGELSTLSFYPQLIGYLTQVNPVMTVVLEAITTSNPIKPDKQTYQKLKQTLEKALKEAQQRQ